MRTRSASSWSRRSRWPSTGRAAGWARMGASYRIRSWRRHARSTRRTWLPRPWTSSTAIRRRAMPTSWRWSARRCSRSRSCAACARRRSSECRTRSAPSAGGSAPSTSRRWACNSERPRGRRLLGDGQALLRPRHGLVRRDQGLTQRRDVAGHFFQALGELVVLSACRLAGEVVNALLDPVEGVFDPLEALGHRPQAPREALDVRRGGDVQGSHGHILGRDSLLARLEGTLESTGYEWVSGQFLGKPAERLFSLPLDPLLDAVINRVVHAAQRTQQGRNRNAHGESHPRVKVEGRPNRAEIGGLTLQQVFRASTFRADNRLHA